MDADALWRRFAAHLARLYAGAADPTVERGSGWLALRRLSTSTAGA
jgi:hypothetical protein